MEIIVKIGLIVSLLPLGAIASKDVAPVMSDLYKSECGACHIAYQPGLLPASSWEKIFTSLGNHFGENAEIDANDFQYLKSYVLRNAADTSESVISKKMMKEFKQGDSVSRITTMPYFLRIHRIIEKNLRKKSGNMISMSRCEACHSHATEGSYSALELRLP